MPSTDSRDAPVDKTELAKDRTDLADDRTVMANERTFAAWLRTGLGALAVGIGFAKLFEASEPTWVAKAGSSLLIAAGLLIFVVAPIRFRSGQRRLEAHAVEAPGAWTVGSMSAILFIAGLVGLIVIWVL